MGCNTSEHDKFLTPPRLIHPIVRHYSVLAFGMLLGIPIIDSPTSVKAERPYEEVVYGWKELKSLGIRW